MAAPSLNNLFVESGGQPSAGSMPALRLTLEELQALNEMLQAGLDTVYRESPEKRKLYDLVADKVGAAPHTDPM